MFLLAEVKQIYYQFIQEKCLNGRSVIAGVEQMFDERECLLINEIQVLMPVPSLRLHKEVAR